MTTRTRKAVIVAGSRRWADEEALLLALLDEDPDVVVHGDCPTGADAVVAAHAELMLECRRYVAVVPVPAQWERLGDGAGMPRNREMLKVLLVLFEHGYEVAVVAAPLPGGRGTQGMVRIAKKAGVRIRIVEEQPGFEPPPAKYPPEPRGI